jgi:hypothetical protein
VLGVFGGGVINEDSSSALLKQMSL